MSRYNDEEGAILRSTDGRPVPLSGTAVRCTIDDVFTRVVVTQDYENREKKNIEAVYAFPLPLDGVLLDFTVTIDGKVRRGAVLKKKAAREQYEDAVEQGDTAAMLEDMGDGLYSMNVGNILAGQKIGISFSYMQFNIWNGTLLRFFLPTVIAPKYGSPSRAGIEDHQAPFTSPAAKNAFKCAVSLTGGMRGCAVSCPTHRVERAEFEDCVRFDVGAFADRDLVLEIRSDEMAVPRACVGRDGDGYVAAVAVTPGIEGAAQREPRDLDIIIDCSGSMVGDSISQARAALKQILARLEDRDSFNVIRFGNFAMPLFTKHMPCGADPLGKAHKLLEKLEADMGGTNLEDAL
ncbi:MAG: VWA domain-containing protein [Mailhella sp.]|nr:VWA domain-containing protein [Mailhella sp.]